MVKNPIAASDRRLSLTWSIFRQSAQNRFPDPATIFTVTSEIAVMIINIIMSFLYRLADARRRAAVVNEQKTKYAEHTDDNNYCRPLF